MNLEKVQSAESLAESRTIEQCRWRRYMEDSPPKYAKKGFELRTIIYPLIIGDIRIGQGSCWRCGTGRRYLVFLFACGRPRGWRIHNRSVSRLDGIGRCSRSRSRQRKVDASQGVKWRSLWHGFAEQSLGIEDVKNLTWCSRSRQLPYYHLRTEYPIAFHASWAL